VTGAATELEQPNVSFGFIAERAGRLGKVAGLLASPLQLLRSANLYVNPRDEIIVVAEPC
jgi:hypothetical protein